MKIVSTWMYSTPPGDKVLHNQVGLDSDLQKTQNYYWRCLFCLFESSHRLNEDVRHILFVNKAPPDFIDGIDIARLIRAFRIEVVILDRFTRPPKDTFTAWNTQFIVLDVIDWLADHTAVDDAVLILDGDCVFQRPIGAEFLADLDREGALLYSLDYSPEHSINGLSRRQLADLSQDYDASLKLTEFVYNGGEFICVMGRELRRIGSRARAAYHISLDRAARGLPKFCEEAHLLSHVYHALGYRTHTGNAYIKRIWTNRGVYSNVDGTELGLTIWHLPAEKKRGFITLFRSLEKMDGSFQVTRRDTASVLGIKPTLGRMIEDYGFWVFKTLKKLTGR
ncbi:hypothetical protein [Methylomagnum sp.]